MAEVVVITSTLAARSPSANVTGLISLKVRDRVFPDAQWNDFPVVILGWWLVGLTELASGASSTYEALFMDGPYKFVVHLVSGHAANLTLHTQEEQWSETIDFQAFYASAAQAGSAVLHECLSRGWSNQDLVLLEAAVARSAA
jgi:hypothetical protein